MIIAVIIIGIILIFFVYLTIYISRKKGFIFDDGVSSGIIITILLLIESILVGYIFSGPRPTAMDVYQGKTTLEYKVVDGVKVDSVVIFKNDDYGKN